MSRRHLDDVVRAGFFLADGGAAYFVARTGRHAKRGQLLLENAAVAD